MSGPSDFFRNVAINIRATGTAAVLCTWILGVTLLGIYGSEKYGSLALGVLLAIGLGLTGSLGQKPRD